MTHPDSASTGFTPNQAWCIQCRAPLRLVGVHYWLGEHGPFCSHVCLTLFKKSSSSPGVNS